MIDNELEADSVRLHVRPQGILVELDFESLALDFPFRPTEFWKGIDRAEGRSLMNLACRSLEAEIRDVEGFDISLYPGAYLDNANWPRIGFPELPTYPYRKAAPDSWTYEQWLAKRLHRLFGNATDTVFDVEEYCALAQSDDDTLAELRQRASDQTHR